MWLFFCWSPAEAYTHKPAPVQIKLKQNKVLLRAQVPKMVVHNRRELPVLRAASSLVPQRSLREQEAVEAALSLREIPAEAVRDLYLLLVAVPQAVPVLLVLRDQLATIIPLIVVLQANPKKIAK